ncbi:MAG: hypothetical protein J0H11_14930 [Rhizobiales bacterium]|nr:hypothetical protein [Hyphomicrobiales bacterium]
MTSDGPNPVPPEMTPWRLKDLIERRVTAGKGASLTPDTTVMVLRALRAYIAVPKRDRLAGIICCRIHIRRVPCKPLCRKCLETAYEIKLELVGEPDWWGDRGRYDGGGR